MTNPEQTAVDFRVGIISFTALCLLVLAITFAGGDKGLLFQRTLRIKAQMADVGGLKTGSSVTMGGMNIGKVEKIYFAGTNHDCPVEVWLQIQSSMRPHIKKDSIPAIRTQGMLGDRYIEIEKGTLEAEALDEGEFLKGNGASDFDNTLKNANSTLQETTKMISAINQQEGTIGRFMYDEAFYTNLNEITLELNEILKDFKKNPRRYVKFSLF